MRTINFILKLSEPGQNKCSGCARLKKDYFEKRAKQHERLKGWLLERYGNNVQIIRSDGKTGFMIINVAEDQQHKLEAAPDVISVRTK